MTEPDPHHDAQHHLRGGLFGGDSWEEEHDELDEKLIRGRRQLRSREVSTEAGVSLLSAKKFWRALGFPAVDEDEQAFTTADVEALFEVSGMVRAGKFDEATALALTRSVGRSVERMAAWQLQLLEEMLAHENRDLTPLEFDEAAAEMVEQLEPLLVYAWRRHYSALLKSHRLGLTGQRQKFGSATSAIGFADLVSFTRLVRKMSERDLAKMVQHFEGVVSDIVVSHDGKVVKTVGDEVLFTVDKVAAAAAIACDIADEIGSEGSMPDVRIGVATGAVVAWLGDVFGDTVNRASRLTSFALPRSVVVDSSTAQALGSVSGFQTKSLRPRNMRGIGLVTPHVLTRSSSRN